MMDMMKTSMYCSAYRTRIRESNL